MPKNKIGRKSAKPKIEHISDDLGCTLLIQLSPVAPELRDFIAYQTGRFVLGFIRDLNVCLVPEEQIDYVNVDSI